ncbi:hypothetical protein BCR42DRAFT_406995 [Absidia repens]|uniref:Uncharacterized protein n=1 Tax=Absidia repens TaxID=90262 RepID=A0A1X2IRL9_9FUNG|nr:hypothetical protein BCR42DRAFT_406995 [Absidia repens]
MSFRSCYKCGERRWSFYAFGRVGQLMMWGSQMVELGYFEWSTNRFHLLILVSDCVSFIFYLDQLDGYSFLGHQWSSFSGSYNVVGSLKIICIIVLISSFYFFSRSPSP